MQAPKREFWNNAEPERLPDAWRMTKAKDDHVLTAVCGVWAVEMGWDLRLMIDGHGLQMSSLCRSGRQMVHRFNEWAHGDAGEGLDRMSAQPASPLNENENRGDSVVDRDVATLNVLPGRNW